MVREQEDGQGDGDDEAAFDDGPEFPIGHPPLQGDDDGQVQDIDPEGGVREVTEGGDGFREVPSEEVEEREGHAPGERGLQEGAEEVGGRCAPCPQSEGQRQHEGDEQGELDPGKPGNAGGFAAAQAQGGAEREEKPVGEDGRGLLGERHVTGDPEADVRGRPPEEQRGHRHQPKQPRPFGEHPAGYGR